MKKLNRFMLSSLLLLAFSFFINGEVTNAASDAGGSATVKGKIIFFEGDETDKPPGKSPVKTPLRLPQTGERTETYQSLGLLVLGSLSCLMVVRKCREGGNR